MEETCDRIQLAMINGEPADDERRAHVDGCAECGFLAGLSRNLTDVSSSVAGEATALGAAFTAALAHVTASGEPLLGRYRLDELRGRGGQGHVYRATDLETKETVAVKLVRATDDAGEVANARRIRDQHVCRVFHTERFGDIRLIVMEYIDGPTLADRLGSLDRDAALVVFRGICAGVAAAHDAEVLHLDLKPGNVLLRGDLPLVTDFGLSRRFDAASTAAGGTPKFMAPEQARRGIVDRRTDVFALGKILEALVPAPSRLLHAIIRRATAHDPADRYADARALLRAVTPSRRTWLRWAIAGTGVLVAGLAIAYFVVPPPTGSRATWYPVWGNDPVPVEAWNVARNLDGEGLPRVVVEGPMFGCGQQPWELLDGVAQYGTWEHGVAWSPVQRVDEPEWQCNLISKIGTCGKLDEDARLCERTGPGLGEFRLLDARVRDRGRFADSEARLGYSIRRMPCGERALSIELDGTYAVFAVRAWHHGNEHAPRHYRVEARGSVVFETFENLMGTRGEHQSPLGPNLGGQSAPVTAMFAPVDTDHVRLVIDTCSTLTDDDLATYNDRATHPERVKAYPGHGWLYEVEVFARLSRRQAWQRRFSE